MACTADRECTSGRCADLVCKALAGQTCTSHAACDKGLYCASTKCKVREAAVPVVLVMVCAHARGGGGCVWGAGGQVQEVRGGSGEWAVGEMWLGRGGENRW